MSVSKSIRTSLFNGRFGISVQLSTDDFLGNVIACLSRSIDCANNCGEVESAANATDLNHSAEIGHLANESVAKFVRHIVHVGLSYPFVPQTRSTVETREIISSRTSTQARATPCTSSAEFTYFVLKSSSKLHEAKQNSTFDATHHRYDFGGVVGLSQVPLTSFCHTFAYSGEASLKPKRRLHEFMSPPKKFRYP